MVLGPAVLGVFFLQKGEAIGDRYLVVIRVNFAEREEAVPVAAVFDESGLEGRLDARYPGQIDIAS